MSDIIFILIRFCSLSGHLFIVSLQCDAQLPSVCRVRRQVSPLLQSVPQSSRASSLIPLPASCLPLPFECLVPNTSSRSSTVHSGLCPSRGLTTVLTIFLWNMTTKVCNIPNPTSKLLAVFSSSESVSVSEFINSPYLTGLFGIGLIMDVKIEFHN